MHDFAAAGWTRVFGCLDPSGVVVDPLQQANPTLGRLSERTPLAHSHYNSLQVSLDRRFTNNVQAQLSYTYSKSIDNGSISSGLEAFSNGNQLIMNPYKPSQDVGPSDFNQTHSFRASSVIALPFRGNPFVRAGSSAGSSPPTAATRLCSAADMMALVKVLTVRTPLPGASPRPRTLGNPNQWWSCPSGFTMPAMGEFGNVGRNTALGPGFLNLDFALLKDTAVPKVSEQFKVEFRAEFFDIINHTNFLPPNSGLSFLPHRPHGPGLHRRLCRQPRRIGWF